MTRIRHWLRVRRRRSGAAGFTLIEALAAVTLTGMILAALGMITAQWLPGWDYGFMRVQRGELFSVALNRLAADLSAAEFVTPNRDTKLVLFEGTPTGVILVRSAIGPNTEPGLEVVHIAEAAERNKGIVLVRARTRFAPFGSGDVSASQLPFTDPVVLLRDPFRVTFSYSEGDGSWKDTWRSDQLPAAVRFLVRDTATRRTLAISSATMVHVDTAACSDDATKGAKGAPGSTPAAGAPGSVGASGSTGAPGPGALGSPGSSGCRNTGASGNAPSRPNGQAQAQ